MNIGSALVEKEQEISTTQMPRSRPISCPVSLIEHAEMRILDLRKAALWQQFERWTRPYRAKVERKVVGFFREQEKEIIASINAGKGIIPIQYRGKVIMSPESKGPREWADWPAWLVTFEEYGQLFLPEVIGDKGALEMQKLLIGVGFDVENPRVRAFINQRSFRFSFDTNAGTQKALQNIFQESLLAGEGIAPMTRKINELFDFKKRFQGEQIARSEVVRAANYGAEQAYIQSGVVSFKEWIVSRDDRLCPFCEPMAGKRVVLGQKFFSRGDTTDGVSDAGNVVTLNLDYEDISHPPLHVQCRCTLSPVLTEAA